MGMDMGLGIGLCLLGSTTTYYLLLLLIDGAIDPRPKPGLAANLASLASRRLRRTLWLRLEVIQCQIQHVPS